MATPIEEVETRRNVSGQQAAVVLLALLALLAIVWFLFLRGSTQDVVDVATPPATAPSVAPTVEPTEEPTNGDKRPVETFEVFAPKDPFKPLIVAATGASATSGVPSVTPTTTDGTTDGAGNGSAPSGGSDISGDDGGSSGNSSNVGGRRVRLIDVFRAGGELRARIQVDGTVYTVAEGDRFADNFEVVSLSGSCASLLYGDDQFSLCEGEEILK